MHKYSFMKIAYILYDGVTLLDFIGLYDPISRLQSMKFIPQLRWDICSTQPVIKDSFGLAMQCNRVNNDLSDYDLLFIPGGFGTRPLQEDPNFIKWLQTGKNIPLKSSVCTGSLLLGAAGFLEGKKATTHFDNYRELEPYCKEVIKERIVEDGDVITAGAVASSLDLGIFLCQKFVGKEKTEQIRQRMDY